LQSDRVERIMQKVKINLNREIYYFLIKDDLRGIITIIDYPQTFKAEK